ncbi:putative ATP-dependent DNA helicase RecS [Pullulanibacillus camelliae]|uniref:Putative ATP-dependent DNA helicase RecS n=1 Tax=Pullulanibacillus camelliae TaxID=1707096 RepID=A0A8J2YGE0_9BACL|nr:ATP-dependent DNA helicase RecQ [Pullulanibacillus camelliae]GGE38465.1 putative ATP-dependent DNA helicase RecS [Pullulanibacillus camelliae]
MLEDQLRRYFGFTTFRPGQREVITDVVARHDVFAMLPTGSGKSLCYLLAGYQLQGLVVIVSPLLSLMEDQVQHIRLYGEKRVAALNSFLPYEERQSVLQQLKALRFLFVSPEMLQSRQLLERLQEVNVVLFTVDEAHCVSQWGYEFRPDYLKLADVRRQLGAPPCLALTATADQRVREDIIDKLKMSDCHQHIYSVDRKNIALKVEAVQGTLEKQDRLIELVSMLQGPGIIYFSTREWTEEGAALIHQYTDLRVAAYHGGMANEERRLIQNQFLNDEIDVVCCTNAFGMGVDKPNVRYVIHFHYPKHMNAYLQEIGRAGRDGRPSLAVVLYTESDHELPLYILQKEYPTEKQLEQVIAQYIKGQDKELVATIALDVGCSETAARFLQEHISWWAPEMDSQALKQRLLQRIQERIALKTKALWELQQWLKKDSCRRARLLTLYDERLETSPKCCCDHCGLQLADFSRQKTIPVSEVVMPWERRLRLLLDQKEGSYGKKD